MFKQILVCLALSSMVASAAFAAPDTMARTRHAKRGTEKSQKVSQKANRNAEKTIKTPKAPKEPRGGKSKK